VHECRRLILKLYEVEYLAKDELATQVQWLLEKDRFVCRGEQREVSSMRPMKVESDADKGLTDVGTSIPGEGNR